jgi:hypothetical protein
MYAGNIVLKPIDLLSRPQHEHTSTVKILSGMQELSPDTSVGGGVLQPVALTSQPATQRPNHPSQFRPLETLFSTRGPRHGKVHSFRGLAGGWTKQNLQKLRVCEHKTEHECVPV